jgi:glycosyltransferase involved in cell wall biosynthesis
MRGDFSRIHIIYPGLDTDSFHPRPDELSASQREEWKVSADHYIFAVVGGYGKPRGKGQREFLGAAARIRQKCPDARFLIVGRGDMADTLRGDIERLGLQGSASLPPYSTDMPRVMNAIDCLVHPQIGTESFGLVVAEAHACGRPVIASNLDGIPEAFACGGYGDLVPAENVEALADAMSRWSARPRLSMDERVQLHSAVRQKASVDLMVNGHVDLYCRLLGSGTSS